MGCIKREISLYGHGIITVRPFPTNTVSQWNILSIKKSDICGLGMNCCEATSFKYMSWMKYTLLVKNYDVKLWHSLCNPHRIKENLHPNAAHRYENAWKGTASVGPITK